MLKITEKSVTSPRKPLTAGQRVSKKYRLARMVKKREYKKLKAIVPSISSKNKVAKITVIEEAIKYIDELHVALAKRMHLLRGIAPNMPCQVSPNMLAPAFPFPPNTINPAMIASLLQSQQSVALKPGLVQMPAAGCHNNARHR